MNQKAVLIFSKVPIAGLVKTRLTETTCLSSEESELLARAMLKDTIALVSESNSDRVEIGYIPDGELLKLQNIVEEVREDGFLNKQVFYYLQVGMNFDERFSSVVNASFGEDNKQLIILGADLPYLNPSLINETFNKLSENKEINKIVIGPAGGGGIYLIGLTLDFNPIWFVENSLFRGGVEISQFINLCREKNLKLILLPPLTDIDIEEDLVSLITYIEALEIATDFKYYHYPRYTTEVIKELGLYIEEIPSETRRRKIGKKKEG